MILVDKSRKMFYPINRRGGAMDKKPTNIVERIRKEVLSEFTRIEGEDYEEWMEVVQSEINARLEEEREKDLFFKSIRYD